MKQTGTIKKNKVMTRKTLAIEIAKGEEKILAERNASRGIATIKAIAEGLLNGAGSIKPLTKAELEEWYNSLTARGYIA